MSKTSQRVSIVVDQDQLGDSNMLIDEGHATKYLKKEYAEVEEEPTVQPTRRQVYKAISQNSLVGFKVDAE